MLVPPLCAVVGAGVAWLLERTDLPGPPHLGGRARAAPGGARVRQRLRLGGARRPGPRSLGRRSRQHALLLPAGHAPRHRDPEACRRGTRGRRTQPGAALAGGLQAGHAAAAPPGAARGRPDHRAAPARRVRRLLAARLPHVHDGDLHRVPARLRRRLLGGALARAGRALPAPAGRGVGPAGPHAPDLGDDVAPPPLAARPAPRARAGSARRARSAGRRSPRRRARLLAARGLLHHPALGLHHRRRPLDGRTGTRGGSDHDARGRSRGRACRPLPHAPGAVCSSAAPTSRAPCPA